MNPPKVFISATTGDLRSIRQLVKEALLTINCHPVEQTNFEPDWRKVDGMLRGKISDCQALIHIVGMRYGAEPEVASLPAGARRRSYTQMEYDLGCQLREERGEERFRVYTFVCPEDFPYDAAPAAAAGSAAGEMESEELQPLQQAHRSAVLGSARLYDAPQTVAELQARVLALREQVLSLQQEQQSISQEVQRSHRLLWVVLGFLGLVGVGLLVMHRVNQRGVQEIVESQKMDTAKIKTHLRESSERRLEEDLKAADLEKKSDDRQRLKDAAQAAHKGRLDRIDDLAANFALLESQADATTEFKELTRILREEGVDKALAYAEQQRPAILRAVAAADAAHLEQKRARLQPLLQAAELQANKGQTAAARAGYEELLKLDPQWGEVLEKYGWFLAYQSSYFQTMGPLTSAVADAEQCFSLAQRFQAMETTLPRAQRLLSSAHSQLGDVLLLRGAMGDPEQVLQHFEASLGLDEALYTSNPDSAQCWREVPVSLEKLGNFMSQRGQPGDAEAALKYFTRSLEMCEKLLLANPDSAEVGRDVSLSLDRLGAFLSERGQPGDADAAMIYCTRSLQIREMLLKVNLDSAEAGRDISVSLNRLGEFLSLRGQSDTALKFCTRSLEIAEKLLLASPDSAQAGRDVSISLNKLGDFLSERAHSGDADTAMKFYTRSLEIAEKLLLANPDSAEAAQDVATNLHNLGDILSRRGQPGDAEAVLKHYSRSLDIVEKLLLANPDSVHAQRELSFSLERLGTFLCLRDGPGDADGAFKHYMRCLQIHEKLLLADPDSATNRRNVCFFVLN